MNENKESAFSFDDIRYLAVALPDDVNAYKFSGDFDGEIRCIDALLQKELPRALRKRLFWERSIAVVMREDYGTDRNTMLSLLQHTYPGLKPEIIDVLIASGHADYILRHGEPWFQDDACANLLNECGNLMRKSVDPSFVPEAPGRDDYRYAVIAEMKEKGSMARRYRVKITLRPDETVPEIAARTGETVTVHLPVAAHSLSQSDIVIEGTSHPAYLSESAQRTVCMTAPYVPGEDFSVEFSYTNTAVYHALSPELVTPDQSSLPDFPREYLDEQYPHIRFTPFLRELAEEIADGETNPLLKARKVYDYITSHIHYSYMRSYLALDNIPEFALLNGRGDCGVQALCFITLCRILGVPAKWESGHSVRKGHIGPHDWAMFYVAPWGWLHADPSYGGGAFQSGKTEIWDYYFGNFDPYRDVTCTEFQTEFDPPKRFMRIDPYDSQKGEIEFEDRGLHDWELISSRRVLDYQEL